jgi:hypothetical protein
MPTCHRVNHNVLRLWFLLRPSEGAETSFFALWVATKIRYNPASHRSLTLGF